MSRRKDEEARREGMTYALKVAKDAAAGGKDPVKALEEECEYRNAHFTPMAISRQQEREYVDEVSKNATVIILGVCCQTLYEEYGFETEDMQGFFERMCEICTNVGAKEYTFEDINQALKDVCGIEIEVRK